MTNLTLQADWGVDAWRTMKLTSFGFVELAETFLKDALSSPPLGGGKWEFQRSVNFNERTSSLQILLAHFSGPAKTKVSIHARQTGTEKDYSIQGWTETPEEEKRTVFVLKESNPVRVEEEVFEIVDRLLASIPERDQSVTYERPAPPPPKSSFEPLIPEIQSTPAEPEPAPAPEVSAESFDSTQAFVDSLLSPDNFDKIPAAEAPASEPSEEPPAEPEQAQEEVQDETTQKSKPTKSAKAKKPAK